MDIYRILEKLAVISNKQTLTEGQMKRSLEDRAEKMSKADFVANAGEYGMSAKEAADFWAAVNGEEEIDEAYDKLPVDQLGLDKFSQAALSGGQRKRDALANPNHARMLAKKSAQNKGVSEGPETGIGSKLPKSDIETFGLQKGRPYKINPPQDFKPGDRKRAVQQLIPTQDKKDHIRSRLGKHVAPVLPEQAGEAFVKGDRVMYLNGFATVVSQDGDAYVVKVDGQPNTMKVPATAIKKPSYNEGVSKSKKAKPDFLDMDKDGNKKESFKKAVQDKKVAESAKPDFLDLDKDGNKKEPMKNAARDKNDAKGSFQKQMGGSAKDLTKGLSIGAKKVSEQLDEVFPGTPEYELRFGKDDASSAFDKKKISTGTVYTRKHQEEPEAADDDTPKKKGRPVGAKRRLGAKGPGVDSKLLKGKGGLKEQDIDPADRGEYDREGDMALNQIHQIADAAEELHSILDANENLPEWVQSKITKAVDYLDTARDYLKSKGEQYTDRDKPIAEYSFNKIDKKDKKEPTLNLPKNTSRPTMRSKNADNEQSISSQASISRKRNYMEEPVDEKAVSKAQQKFMGMVHAAKKGEKPASAAVAKVARGMSSKDAEDFAATKHKGLPKKVKKDEAVEETTVAGSVATSAAPAKSKGGMQFGKGVYEGALAESFENKMKQLNEGYSVNVTVDDGGRKNITVTASDEQADQLGQMLKMAGLFSSEGYSRVCDQCSGIHEAGACGIEQVEEELANAPDEQYSDTDTMVNTLSGGLNGPKLQSNPNNMGDNPLAMSRLGHTSSPSLNLGDIAEGVEKESTTRLWDLYRDYKSK